jgi:hypothetical protein
LLGLKACCSSHTLCSLATFKLLLVLSPRLLLLLPLPLPLSPLLLLVVVLVLSAALLPLLLLLPVSTSLLLMLFSGKGSRLDDFIRSSCCSCCRTVLYQELRSSQS